jgi:hypothetical protein
MTNEEVFKIIISESIHSNLKILGFIKQSTNFIRRLNDFIQIVNVQKSQWNTNEETRFVLNIGFYNSEFHRELTQLPEPKNPKEYDCFVRFRLNQITHHTDYWYSIIENQSYIETKNNVHSDIITKLIPFLEANRSFEKLYNYVLEEEWLKNQVGPYTIAYLHLKKGRTKKALDMLKNLYNEASKPREVVLTTSYPDGRQEKKVSIEGPRKDFMNRIKEICIKYDLPIDDFL